MSESDTKESTEQSAGPPRAESASPSSPPAPSVPSNWLNAAIEARPAFEGEQISVEVKGGWVRSRTPLPGVVITTRSGYDIYVPAEMLVKALHQVRRKKTVR